MARSLKTFAHALTLAASDRILSTPRPEYTLRLQVTEAGKVFTLRCGAEVVTVKAADHGGSSSVRSIADQLCERLAASAGCNAPQMAISEGEARPMVKLDLAPINVASKRAAK